MGATVHTELQEDPMSPTSLAFLRPLRLFLGTAMPTALGALALTAGLVPAGLPAADPSVRARFSDAAGDASTAAPADLLSTGDLVHVEVYDNPDLTIDLRVPQDGPVQFPLVGGIDHINGMTCDELSAKFRSLLEARFLNQALVTTTIKEMQPRRAFVMGAVVKPGAIELASDHSGTAIRALSEAGGLGDDADRRHIVVLRDTANGPTAVPVTIDAAPGEGGDVVLRPNDLIMVARLDRIYVTGQVKMPGSVPSDPGKLTVTKAISLVGGFDRYARPTKVQLLRPGAPIREIDVEAVLKGQGDDPLLIPGDMINVPERRF
jgi:polysaccharide export outer membrane protein